MPAARGRFIPKNPNKYIGNPNDIWFRSSWEIVAMKRFDSSPSVLKWCSEEIAIPYIKPTDGKVHNYFPDFIVIYRGRAGEIVKSVIEVKPLKETLDEEANNMYDKVALTINKAKWAAASHWCAARGMKFEIVTERTLFFNVQKPVKKMAKKPTVARKSRGTRK
jgi:hypothetical protein